VGHDGDREPRLELLHEFLDLPRRDRIERGARFRSLVRRTRYRSGHPLDSSVKTRRPAAQRVQAIEEVALERG